MPGDLAREIRRLEARLDVFLQAEDAFVTELRDCLAQFKKLTDGLERLEAGRASERVTDLSRLRLEAAETLNAVLQRQSKAEHEKSHILESYGALILALETRLQSVP
ncbi:hypothetical protein AC480_02510 [miscellaneous Crenarchaeota group archaeon SMTZ1-55]|nr:MAG: hypothetical protein AC480_02510 [miscellaneous Crenarchaeota group archaeon SMTZ1-55]